MSSDLVTDAAPTRPPSRHEPVVAGATTLIGGPLGRRATGGRGLLGRRAAAGALVLLTLVVMAVGWLQKSPCREGWEGDYAYTRLCYTDVYPLWFAEGLDQGRTPYLEHAVEYPVGIGTVMATAATLAEPFIAEDRSDGATRYFDATALLMTVGAVIAVLTTGALAGRRRWWDAGMVAASPLLVIHGLINWDLAALALTGFAMVAWARSRPLLAGLLLGAATATKLYPGLLLIALLLLCLRAGRLRAWLRAAVGTVVGVLALYLPVYLVSPRFSTEPGGAATVVAPAPLTALGSADSFGEVVRSFAPHAGGGESSLLRFLTLNRTRPADWDSLWFTFQQATGTVIGVPLLNVLVAVSLIGAVVAIALMTLLAPRRPRVAQVMFLLVVAFLLTNKVYSPQFSLWLLPLAVLARPRWGWLLAWQAAEVAVLASRFYYFVGGVGDPSTGVPYWWFGGAVLLRDGLLVALCVLVVREIYRPDTDVVRADLGPDDPAGGVLADRPDRWGLGRRSRDPRHGHHPEAAPVPG